MQTAEMQRGAEANRYRQCGRRRVVFAEERERKNEADEDADKSGDCCAHAAACCRRANENAVENEVAHSEVRIR